MVSPASTCADRSSSARAEVVGDRLPRLGPFDEDGEILGAAPQRLAEIAILLEPPAALQQLLRAGLVLPEVRIGDARFDCREFFGGAWRRQR